MDNDPAMDDRRVQCEREYYLNLCALRHPASRLTGRMLWRIDEATGISYTGGRSLYFPVYTDCIIIVGAY